MPDEPQPHAEDTVPLGAAQAEDPRTTTPPPRGSATLDDLDDLDELDELDELEDTIPGRPMAQLLARHVAASAAAEQPAHDTPGTSPSDPQPAAGQSADASPADEATLVSSAPSPTLDDAATLADDEAAAAPDGSETEVPPAPEEPATAAALPADDAGTPALPAVAETPAAPTPQPNGDTYAAARTQPAPSIPEVAAPTEPMSPIVRDSAVSHPSDGGARPTEQSQRAATGRVHAPSAPPPATQITPRLGMPPIDALAAHGNGNGNGHGHHAAPAPRPERTGPAAPARPRMVDVSGIHSRVPPEYWLDEDPIEETRLSLGLRGARAVKTEAGRPLPQPRRFKRAPRWLTIVVLLFVTAAVAVCVGGAIATANVYLQHPHTTGPVPASTVAPKASPTAPKR